jgi:hypothetical protein
MVNEDPHSQKNTGNTSSSTAAGMGSVSIAGSVRDSVIITGNGNVIGDSSLKADRQVETPTHSTKAIRQLVEDALTDDELSDLCQDDFPRVYSQFTTGQSKSQRIRTLVEYAQKQREIPKLLKTIEAINPNAYLEFSNSL